MSFIILVSVLQFLFFIILKMAKWLLVNQVQCLATSSACLKQLTSCFPYLSEV